MNTEIKIEKGIPIPQRQSGRPAGNGLREKLEPMQVGDSFLIETDRRLSFCGQLTKAGKSLGYKFSTRKLSRKETRVWRTA